MKKGTRMGGHAPVELAHDPPQEGIVVGADPGTDAEAGIEPGVT